ncbi:hypothetical protein K504DRAFT_471254 [Pleomassaria siparia CBS 279.74]|uniref:Uncharacterized protein n=1 Tax=Pleomassaria siparia CBS 279.74 TaxID=1314801 RepID=A0A6G1JYZ2_9PLEO|nr:hypothetical protein K504DRAFT_471254 [Pleomassaria siparia CBS 279.74]
MDPLPQYPDHAFIPYLRPSSPTDPPPINLLNTSTWTYCGPLLEPTSDALPPSFHTWATSTIDGPLLPRLLPFLDFLHGFLSKAGAQHYWLTIRVTKPTSEYDVVRWHTDDLFFDYDGEKDRLELDETWTRDRDEKMTTTTTTTTTTRTRTKTRTRTRRRRKRRSSSSSSQSGKKKKTEYWKMATTLLGPGTLFLQDGAQARLAQHAAKAAQLASRSGGPHTCTSFRCPNCLDAVEAVRQTLAHSLASEPVESPQYGQVAFFRLGSEKGAVHSEPRCPVDRIFVNVVPGSETELSGLMSRWGMDFPTSWCFDDDDDATTRKKGRK